MHPMTMPFTRGSAKYCEYKAVIDAYGTIPVSISRANLRAWIRDQWDRQTDNRLVSSHTCTHVSVLFLFCKMQPRNGQLLHCLWRDLQLIWKYGPGQRIAEWIVCIRCVIFCNRAPDQTVAGVFATHKQTQTLKSTHKLELHASCYHAEDHATTKFYEFCHQAIMSCHTTCQIADNSAP